jgi:multicomponent K+:H+ antiporter subunit A
VILVDFRGYDTLGEITVLAIAMMGVLALLAAATPARSVRGRSADGVVMEHQPHLSSPMLRTGVRLILPLSLLLAAYVFFKGHQEPGGGFIAGLIASVGLAAYRMATGVEALKRLLPIKPGVTAAIGLSIALATAAAPLLFGVATSGEPLPILTSNHSYLPLPGGGEYHWTSVVLFDLGVFIVVVGVSVGMINRFEEELDR